MVRRRPTTDQASSVLMGQFAVLVVHSPALTPSHPCYLDRLAQGRPPEVGGGLSFGVWAGHCRSRGVRGRAEGFAKRRVCASRVVLSERVGTRLRPEGCRALSQVGWDKDEMPCRAGKPPSDEGKSGSRPHPRSACPRVITCGQGPLAFRRGSLLFLRPLATCDEASPRPTEDEDTQRAFFCAGALRLLRALTGARSRSGALTGHASTFSSVTGAGFRAGALTGGAFPRRRTPRRGALIGVTSGAVADS
jgi:hypothetical protein